MRKDIDLFLIEMENVLSSDLIAYIISTYVYKEANVRTIRKQKEIKKLVCEELVEFFGLCYSDRNIKLYRNQQDQIVLKNFTFDNRFFLYSERDQQQAAQAAHQPPLLLQSEHEKQAEQNEIVLFNNPTNQVVYDANGFPVQKKIKLYIMYI